MMFSSLKQFSNKHRLMSSVEAESEMIMRITDVICWEQWDQKLFVLGERFACIYRSSLVECM